MAEEPPAEVQRQIELYKEIRATSDDARQQELLREILDIQADFFPAIGIAYDGNFYGISVNRLNNTRMSIASSWDYPTPAPSNPNTFFFA